MFVIKRIYRSNPNKKSSLINYISTTITARCQEPRDGIEKEKKKDDDKTDEQKEKESKSSSKKLLTTLYEYPVSNQERDEALQMLKSLDINKEPETKHVEVTQIKEKPKIVKRPVEKALKSSKTPFEQNLLKSVKKVADEFGGDVNETEKDLLNLLNNFSLDPKKSFEKNEMDEENAYINHQINARKLFKNLNVMNKRDTEKQKSEDSLLMSLEGLMTGTPGLNIFSDQSEPCQGPQLKLWDELLQDELKYLSCAAPRNYFGELIKWTEEGKLWHFPINNEQGMDEEAEVDFSEHVFLEDLLEPWCPKSGPLRHFMELVCVGLSKNPYLKVKDKHEHIFWFRDYFENKRKMLQDLGAFSGGKQIEESKMIESKEKE